MNVTCRLTIFAVAAGLLWLPAVATLGQTPDVLSKAPAWQPPEVEQVRREVFIWLTEQQADEQILAAARSLWDSVEATPTGSELLTCLAETVSLVDKQAGQLLAMCSGPRSVLVPPDEQWLTEPETSPLVSANFRLLYGRWLVHERLFDEALQQLVGLEPKDVVDPASLLFYQGIAYQKLLDRKAGLKSIGQLLDGAENSPQRYSAVARLIQADLKSLEEDTLDHIARRMDDIDRRLELGRAGPKVREIEDGVIESLDKLIEEIEKQQQQQAGASGNNLQPSNPAQDSKIMGGRGPGHVTKRDIGQSSGWGDLPPKKRQEAMQQIGREFPAHYRDAIEQYFRKLAGEGDDGE